MAYWQAFIEGLGNITIVRFHQTCDTVTASRSLEPPKWVIHEKPKMV